MSNQQTYRKGIGGVIINNDKKIFLAERIDLLGQWQMPQGGIEENESLETSLLREINEEIGTRKVKILGKTNWLSYKIPQEIQKTLWNGKYNGQEQTWFFLQFLGTDNDINLKSHFPQEFKEWKWASKEEVLSSIIYFKKDLYNQIIAIGEEKRFL